LVETALSARAEPTVFAAVCAETGLDFAVTTARFAVAEFVATALTFGVELALAVLTGTALTFGASFLAPAFVSLGEGLPTCAGWLAGVTLTVAGVAAGVCTVVGVCANAAADRSMSVPRFRII
jgi:hypothetical protein